MNIKQKISYFLKNPAWLIVFLNNRGIHLLSDKKYISLLYKLTLNKKLNLENPQTFNEKLQWLKLYDRKPEYTKMVDKYEVREIIKEKIGEEYLIPLIGVYDNFNDIDFDKLPNQFVLKCTHDSGSVIICKDKAKFNIKKAKKKINKCLKKNFYYSNREWPYKNVKPRIVVEKYMEDESKAELKDYKFFCFNGEPKFIQVDFGRFYEHKRNLYTLDWKLLDLRIGYPTDKNTIIKKPKQLEKMIEFSKILSKNIPHLRVDFYSINDKIYFGELTFYHSSGLQQIEPFEWNIKLGNILNLPNK